MPIILSAIDTLYEAFIQLTLRSLYGLGFTDSKTEMHESPILLKGPVVIQPQQEIHEEVVEKVQEEHDEEIALDQEKTTFKAVSEILKVEDHISVQTHGNTIMYAGSITVPLYKHPTIEFDAQVTSIPYGEMVMMLEPKGRFFHVIWGVHDGWVLREDLVDRAIGVYPEFTIGEENLVDHPNTARVRSILEDIFGLNRSEFPLQAGEYVLYRLWKKGVRIAWPEARPRIPGLWHKILKGIEEIHIGVIPKAGAIMEYMQHDDIGHVAFVEAVFPDDTITISEVNYPHSGIYNERELTKAEWKELRPVFIKIG